jgi:tetratricopeptide (TPR) repeat protein
MDSPAIPELGKSGRDLLIAEMLGDIGRLHDEVAALKQSLPRLGHDLRATLESQTGQLHSEAGRIEKAVAEYQKSQRDSPGALGMQDQLAVMKATMSAAERTARAADEAGNRLQQAMQRIEQLQRQASGQRRILFLMAAMALLGLGFGAGHLIGI